MTKDLIFVGNKLGTKELLALKTIVEPLAGINFNSVLLNYCPDERDLVALHRDKENGHRFSSHHRFGFFPSAEAF